MKRLLLSFAAAAVLLPAFAQTINPNAKVDPKNNKVSRPVVEKPKPKLMTRDELRSCMDRNNANVKEADAIKLAQTNYKDSAAQLQKEKQGLIAAEEAYAADAKAAKQERDDILKMLEDIKAAAPKMEKAELEAKDKEYKARAAAFDARVSAVNDAAKTNAARRKAFAEKIDEVDASFKALEERTEVHLDKADAWKTECGNKAYDEADEIAIKKERAAAAK